MRRCAAIVLTAFCFLALLLVLSPLISLALPLKLANHAYYRLLYNVIADRQTRGCATQEDKAVALFGYAAGRLSHQGVPYKCKPAESFIYGEAYCDFKARALNELLGVGGIESRYAMLADRDNPDISPHTLNEVLLQGKWCVFDPSTNIIFRDNSGKFVSLADMSEDFGLISGQEKLAALKIYNRQSYDDFISWMRRMFPIASSPARSTPRIRQRHVFDRVLDGYSRIFGERFFNAYQDIYLKTRAARPGEKDFEYFFLARNYHLAYRHALAREYYLRLLKDFPQSKYRQDAVFFLGALEYDCGDYRQAIVQLRIITDKYPSKWGDFAYYYLGKAYAALGGHAESLQAYSKVNELKLDAQVLRELNRNGFSKTQK